MASARVFDAFALELALGNLATHGPGGVGDGVVEPRGASPVELPGAKVAEAQAAREARLVGGSAAHLAQDDELRAGVEVQPEALEVVEEGVLAAARARGDAGDVSERVFRRERVVRRATRGIAERLERRANGREGARVAALIGVVRPRRRAIRRANLRGGGVAAEIQRVVVLRAAEIVHRGPRIVPIRGDATGRGGARAGGEARRREWASPREEKRGEAASEDGARECGADGEHRRVRTRPGEGDERASPLRFVRAKHREARDRRGAFNPIERASVNGRTARRNARSFGRFFVSGLRVESSPPAPIGVKKGTFRLPR